jgi:hypothetical protein
MSLANYVFFAQLYNDMRGPIVGVGKSFLPQIQAQV